jgi:histidine triad (HIT) family protein
MTAERRCPFCAIGDGDAPAYRLYEDDDVLGFLDIHPATEGHSLVIPKRHVADIFDAPEAVSEAVMRGAVRVAGLLRESLAFDGVNLVQATGAMAWQTIFHLHVHAVPRYRDDPLQLPWRPSAPTREELEAVHQRVMHGEGAPSR